MPIGVFVLGLLVCAQTVCAQSNDVFLAYAQKTLEAARERYHHEPTNAEAAWQFGRACFDRAEFAVNDTERAKLAVEGIDVMRRLVAREPKLAAAHFYLAMNLGQMARTKLLGALKIVEEMEEEFKEARDLDEHFEQAGADRNLGLLYFQAPGWPASIGNKAKARKYLERAVVVAPDSPENHLNLLEAYIAWDDKDGVRRELKAIKDMWPQAQKKFTGEAWASSWADWNKRRGELESKSGFISQP
jgi:tetratricopeptide (TPR) repeat protein